MTIQQTWAAIVRELERGKVGETVECDPHMHRNGEYAKGACAYCHEDVSGPPGFVPHPLSSLYAHQTKRDGLMVEDGLTVPCRCKPLFGLGEVNPSSTEVYKRAWHELHFPDEPDCHGTGRIAIDVSGWSDGALRGHLEEACERVGWWLYRAITGDYVVEGSGRIAFIGRGDTPAEAVHAAVVSVLGTQEVRS